jgi:hypothetical protein
MMRCLAGLSRAESPEISDAAGRRAGFIRAPASTASGYLEMGCDRPWPRRESCTRSPPHPAREALPSPGENHQEKGLVRKESVIYYPDETCDKGAACISMLVTRRGC